MSATNKRKGSKFEIDVLKWFRCKGYNAERLRLAGSKDEGDLVVYVAGKPYLFECKATKKIDLPQFWRELEAEVINYAAARDMKANPIGYVLVKRRNASTEDAWVIQTLKQWSDQYKDV
jgi:Holliday junction resolvase